MYDTTIIQYVIPLEEDAKPYQQILRKMHPKLEPLENKDLNNLLDTKIIFLVWNYIWVEKLVQVWKKNGNI